MGGFLIILVVFAFDFWGSDSTPKARFEQQSAQREPTNDKQWVFSWIDQVTSRDVLLGRNGLV
jgi:hypothetical protein